MSAAARKERLIYRDGLHCCYCGKATVYERGNSYNTSPNRTSEEHIIPKCLLDNNCNNDHNLLLACARCNANRGSKFTDELKAIVKSFTHERKIALLDLAKGQQSKPTLKVYIEFLTKEVEADKPAITFSLFDIPLSSLVRSVRDKEEFSFIAWLESNINRMNAKLQLWEQRLAESA